MTEVLLGETSTPLLFRMTDSEGEPATGRSPEVYLSKNGGPFAPAAGAVSEIGRGIYALHPSLGDVAVAGPLVLAAEAEEATSEPMLYQVVPVSREGLAAALAAQHDVSAEEVGDEIEARADQILLAQAYEPRPTPQIVIPDPAGDPDLCVVYVSLEDLSNKPTEGIDIVFRLVGGPAKTERMLAVAAPARMVTGPDGKAQIALQRTDRIEAATDVYYEVICPEIGLRKAKMTLTTETYNLADLV